MTKIIGNTTATPYPRPDWEQNDPTKADYIKNKPSKVSQLENDSGYITSEDKTDINARITTVQEKADSAYAGASAAYSMAEQAQNNASYAISQISLVEDRLSEDIVNVGMLKADKAIISTRDNIGGVDFDFSAGHNTELRTTELTSISFTFGNGEYPQDYVSGLSFDSGATPTAIDYTDSGILNWVGTDCAMSDGLSIFQPSPNTHYDIVFYFNGTQFIGLVNGFVSSISWQGALPTGNEAV